MAFRFDLPDIDDSYALADWVEVMFLLTKKPRLSRSQMVDGLTALFGSTPQELEPSMNFLFAEIARRRRVAGAGYPLVVEDATIKLDSAANLEFYKFLLLVSLDGPMRQEKRYNEIDEIFDKVVGEAACGYFGEGTRALRFGWPPSDGRPTGFQKALDWLSEKTGIDVGSGQASPKDKDGGVDVVAWKPFADNRTAFLFALIQCTVRTDWPIKAKDIVDDLWRARIDTGRDALTLLAIPFVIHKNYDRWDDLRRTVNIVFDRLRLAQVLGGCDTSAFDGMIKWSAAEIAKYSFQGAI